MELDIKRVSKSPVHPGAHILNIDSGLFLTKNDNFSPRSYVVNTRIL